MPCLFKKTKECSCSRLKCNNVCENCENTWMLSILNWIKCNCNNLNKNKWK